MTLWSSVINLPTKNGMNEMKSFYDRKGMSEIRGKYAKEIEERLFEQNANIITDAVAIQFCNRLEEFIRASSEPQTKISLMCSCIKQIKPLEFYTHLIEGMAMEVLLTNCEIRPSNEMDQLEFIKQLIKSCDEFYQIPSLCLEPEMNQTSSNGMSNPLTYLVQIFQACGNIQRSVFDELKNWQRQQIRNCNEDVPQLNKLNQIQNCIELLVEVTFRLLQLIESLRMIRMQNRGLPDENLERLAQEVQLTQKTLLMDSFIVDNQPNQVIKTNTNFAASVRWLIGPQLGSKNITSDVKCIVVSEKQAKNLYREPQINHIIESSSTEIRGNIVKMEYQEQNRVYSANFNGLQLKKIKRSDRRGSSDSVMDEKFALLFQMTVTIRNSSLTISTLSLPVVVIVHGNQEHQACATIMWDNAFAEVGREPFVVPDIISWANLSDALYHKCFSETKRGFTDANRCFLFQKFLPNYDMIPHFEISWTKFCKDPITSGLSFTFWDWFYYIIKLIKEHLLEPWNDALIEGFISKIVTAEKLQLQAPGTFLLRFSDSIRGAITISYVSAFNTVEHVQPWTIKELQNRCLADRIRDLNELKYLFPHNIDKNEFFGKYCSKDDRTGNDGYVPGIPITTIIRRQ